MNAKGASSVRDTLTKRLLSSIVEVRENETSTALLMFGYSFLAMTAYNIMRLLHELQAERARIAFGKR